MRKGNHCILKVRSVYLLVVMKMSKVTNFFNHLVMKLLLEEMLNLMKISRPASIIRLLCLLRPMILIQCLCLLMLWFLLHMMIVRMKIHLHLLTLFQMSPLNLNHHQLHCFLDESIQHEKQLVILSVILQINIEHVHSSSEPLLFWLKFQKLMI